MISIPIKKTFEASPGILKKEIIRPKRIVERIYDEQVVHQDGETQRFQKKKRFDLAQESIYFLDKSWTIYSGCGFLKDANQNWILESFSFPYEQEFKENLNKELQSNGVKKKVHLSEKLFLFTNVGYTNYYHVLTELLPRLEFYLPFKGVVKIAVSESIPNFLRDAFNIMGISESDLVILNHGVEYSADLIITQPWGMNFIPERFEFLKNALNGNPKSSEKLIYVSRANEQIRTIVNEEELFSMFRKHGIEVHFAEKLSLQEQINVFSSTKLLIGPHGAGLSNLLFMEHPKVLEIRPEEFPNECMSHLALANKADSITTYLVKSVNENLSMRIDLQQFENVLLDLLY